MLRRAGGKCAEDGNTGRSYHVSRVSGIPRHKRDTGYVPLQDPERKVCAFWLSSVLSVTHSLFIPQCVHWALSGAVDPV